MNTPQEQQQEVYEEATELFREWYGEHLFNQGACLYWSQVAIRVLMQRGERAILQAGDMLWPCLRDDPEQPERPTHFGYQWSPEDPFSVAGVESGGLPEVHIWVALPDRGEIVDFATAGFKKLAKERHGLPWETEEPPLYLWGRPPGNVLYAPRLEAMKFVWGFILEKQGLGDLIPA